VAPIHEDPIDGMLWIGIAAAQWKSSAGAFVDFGCGAAPLPGPKFFGARAQRGFAFQSVGSAAALKSLRFAFPLAMPTPRAV